MAGTSDHGPFAKDEFRVGMTGGKAAQPVKKNMHSNTWLERMFIPTSYESVSNESIRACPLTRLANAQRDAAVAITRA